MKRATVKGGHDVGLTKFERDGDDQLRPAAPANVAIDELLTYLADVGFDAAPRSRGVTDDGRLRLSWIEGTSGEPSGDGDEQLVSLGRLLRRFHDAIEGFTPVHPLFFMEGAPLDGTLVCHNDVGPVNTIFRGPDAVALIDWDLAGLGSRIWDLAYAAWRSVPLYDDAFFAARKVPPPERPRRLRLFLDAYGLEERAGFSNVVEARIQGLYDTARVRGERGEPGWTDVWRDTRGTQWLRSVAFTRAHADEWDESILR
jgi:Phosphotransferase enzyme family